MLPSFFFAALVALTPMQSPAPSPSAPPVLQEIAHVRASACQTLISHANVTIDVAMQNDVDLTRTVRALKTSHLNGTAIERRNSLQELETLAKDIDQRATAGNKEIKELRRIADATSDPKKKQEILAFANAIGGAIYRQYKIAFDLNGFIQNLETRDTARADDTFGNMNSATTAPSTITPGASGVTVNGQPVDSGGFGSDQPAVGPMGVQRLLPTDDDAMANSLADDFISQIHDVTTDEATASTHADGATSGLLARDPHFDFVRRLTTLSVTQWRSRRRRVSLLLAACQTRLVVVVGLRVLSVAAMIDAFGTVLLGSWTRINGAGMTCPDWPACHGQLIPSFANGTIWEWTHRLLAALLTPLVLAVIALAWRERRRLPLFIPAAMLAGILFISQVLLGAATVHLANSPLSVVLHWATAMAFIASLAAITVFAWATSPLCHTERRRSADETLILGALAGTAFLAFATMCVGAYVSSSGAGLACLSIPGCAGNVVVYSAGQYVQMVHRCIAGATLICSAGVFALAWVRQTSVRVRVMTTLGLGLVFVQVLLGLLNVVMRLPMDLREAHAANAALVFLAFVVAALFALLDTRNFDVGNAAFSESHSAVHTS